MPAAPYMTYATMHRMAPMTQPVGIAIFAKSLEPTLV